MIQPFWNYVHRALNDSLPFDLAIPLLGLYPKVIIGKKDLYKNIYSHTFCGGKKMENEGMSFNWGMAEQVVVSAGDGILLYPKE